MKMTERARRAGGAAVAAVVIGGSVFLGVFLGVTGEGPVKSGSAPAATASPMAPASYANVVRQVLPSVVQIRTPDGLGSGVVLDTNGNIVTNAHVAGNATTFQVQVAGDPAPRDAKLVGSYPPDDLAVIHVGDTSGLQPARFGDSDKAQAGDVVLAVGNPLGLSSSVTEGIISATGRTVIEPAAAGSAAALPGAIQTSAPINPGNSGGALVNLAGQVIGIPTLAAADPQIGGAAAGIGFAIPSDTVTSIAAQLIATGKVTSSGRASLGISAQTVADASGQPAGIGVVAVTPGGAAAKVGIQSGDIITALAGQPTASLAALQSVLAARKPGDRVQAQVSRDGATSTVTVTLGSLSS